MATQQPRKKLGEILVEQGVLKQEEVSRALEIQKHEGGLIGEILIRHKMVTEEDIVIALATQFGYPYLPVESFSINPEAVKLVPPQWACKFRFIPVDKIANFLTVVMADPSDDEAIRQIEQVTGCRVQAFLGTVTEIENAIRRQYKISTAQMQVGNDEKVKMTLRNVSEQNPGRDHDR